VVNIVSCQHLQHHGGRLPLCSGSFQAVRKGQVGRERSERAYWGRWVCSWMRAVPRQGYGRGFPKTWGYSNLCMGMPPKPAKKPRNSSLGVDRHHHAALRGCGGGPPAPFYAQHPPIASCPPNIPPTPFHPSNTPPTPFHPPNTPIMSFHPPNTPLMPSLPPNIPPMLSLPPNIPLTPSCPPDTSPTWFRCVGWMSVVGMGLVGVGVWGASWCSHVGIGVKTH